MPPWPNLPLSRSNCHRNFRRIRLTAVIQAGAKEVLRPAVQAEVSAFIAEHAHLLDEDGRQRLVRHGFLPEREMMTGNRDGPSAGAARP